MVLSIVCCRHTTPFCPLQNSAVPTFSLQTKSCPSNYWGTELLTESFRASSQDRPSCLLSSLKPFLQKCSGMGHEDEWVRCTGVHARVRVHWRVCTCGGMRLCASWQSLCKRTALVFENWLLDKRILDIFPSP